MSDQKRTPEDLQRTFRDVTDPNYAEPLEEDDLSWDAVAVEAATIARASAAIETNSQAFYLLPSSRETAPSAQGAQKAEGWVFVSRLPGSGAFSLRIPAGKGVVMARLDSRGQPAQLEAFVLNTDLVFDVGELGPLSAVVVATRPGNQANHGLVDGVSLALEGSRTVELSAIVASGLLTDTGKPDVFTAGDVGRYLRIQGEATPRRIASYSQTAQGLGQVMVEGGTITGSQRATLLEWSELGVVLEQVTPLEGGRHAELEAIGQGERGMPRGPGEADLDYAYRVSELPDVVSPAAIERTLARILSPLEIPYELLEVRDPGLRGFVLDVTPLDAGGACLGSSQWSGAVLLSDSATKRFFLVCVTPREDLGFYGLFLDAANAGVNFYDCAEQAADGGGLGYQNALATLWNALNTARAGGVSFRLVEHRDYLPITHRTVTLVVTLASGAAPYMAVRAAALDAFFQLLPTGAGTTIAAISEALAGALVMAGLNPSVTITCMDSLTGVLREKLDWVI